MINLRHSHQADRLQRKLIQKTSFSQLQICDRMSIEQYVISGPSNVIYKQFYCDINGTPSVVWQQQMEKIYIKTYKLVQNDSPDRYYEMDYTADFETQF